MRWLPLLLVLTSTAYARHDRTVAGDVIKAARFLQSARLDDARAVLTDLQKRAPDTVEVKWLEAELAFQTGDYATATSSFREALADDPDDAYARSGLADVLMWSRHPQIRAAFAHVLADDPDRSLRHRAATYLSETTH